MQFKEPLYYKGVNAPLPGPFYRLQLHEMNAYSFQFSVQIRSPIDVIADINNIICSILRLAKLGMLNRKSFDTERFYYKDCNVLDNFELYPEILDDLYGKYSEKSFNLSYQNSNVICNKYSINQDNYFSLNFYKNDELNVVEFGIKDGVCTVYGIHPAMDVELSFKDYELICNKALDLVINFAKAYDIKEMNINPCSLHINKHKFKNILKSIKENYSSTQQDMAFNKIYNAFPKNNIVKQIIDILDLPTPQNFVPDIIKEQDELLKMHIEYTISKNKGIEKDDN